MLKTEAAFVPVLNIPRADFPLRTESTFLLLQQRIPEEVLVFRDEIDLSGLHKAGLLSMTLVDHHILPSKDAALEAAVVEVMDHRPLEWERPPPCRVTAELVGSCATLVTERLLQAQVPTLDGQIAAMLYGTILLDCVNMAVEAGKVTPRDAHCVSRLESSFSELQPRNRVFDALQRAKFDVSGLTTEQMLRKDLKSLASKKATVAISAVYMSLQDFLHRPGIERDLAAFCHQKGFDLLIAMTIFFGDHKKPFRQLAVYSLQAGFQDAHFLTNCVRGRIICTADLRKPPLYPQPPGLGWHYFPTDIANGNLGFAVLFFPRFETGCEAANQHPLLERSLFGRLRSPEGRSRRRPVAFLSLINHSQRSLQLPVSRAGRWGGETARGSGEEGAGRREEACSSWPESSSSTREVCQALERSNNPSLGLTRLETHCPTVRAYQQGNTSASRKKVLPIVREFLHQWVGPSPTGPGMQPELSGCVPPTRVDPQGAGCRDPRGAAKDAPKPPRLGEEAAEEDTLLPPTPMNSLVDECPLNRGLPEVSPEAIFERVNRIAIDRSSGGCSPEKK